MTCTFEGDGATAGSHTLFTVCFCYVCARDGVCVCVCVCVRVSHDAHTNIMIPRRTAATSQREHRIAIH